MWSGENRDSVTIRTPTKQAGLPHINTRELRVLTGDSLSRRIADSYRVLEMIKYQKKLVKNLWME